MNAQITFRENVGLQTVTICFGTLQYIRERTYNRILLLPVDD